MASNLVICNCADKFYYIIVHSYLEVCMWILNSAIAWTVWTVQSQRVSTCVQDHQYVHKLCCWETYSSDSSAKKLCCGACPEKNFGSLLAIPLYNLPWALRFSAPHVHLLLWTLSLTKRKPLTRRLSWLSNSAAPSSSEVVNHTYQ